MKADERPEGEREADQTRGYLVKFEISNNRGINEYVIKPWVRETSRGTTRELRVVKLREPVPLASQGEVEKVYRVFAQLGHLQCSCPDYRTVAHGLHGGCKHTATLAHFFRECQWLLFEAKFFGNSFFEDLASGRYYTDDELREIRDILDARLSRRGVGVKPDETPRLLQFTPAAPGKEKA